MRPLALVALVVTLCLPLSCKETPPSTAGDADGDVDTDADAGADGDVDADADADADDDDDADDRPCTTPPVANGALTSAAGSIDFTGAPVEVDLGHRLDLEVDGDGCLARVGLVIRLVEGCQLELRFGAFGEGWPLRLTQAVLTVEACPGWPEALRGLYYRNDDDLRIDLPERVPGRLAEEACLQDVTLGFEGTLTLRAGDTLLELDPRGLSIRGDLLSRGDDGLTCPCTSSCATDGDADVDVDGDADADADADADVEEGLCDTPVRCLEMSVAMFDLMNADRAIAGCGPLTWNPNVAFAAFDCAAELALLEDFTSSWVSVQDRLVAHDMPSESYLRADEIRGNGLSVASMESSVAGSEWAATGLLDCDYTEAAAAVALGSSGEWMYFCQYYVQPL